MPKPTGHFVGYKSFAVDPNWVKTQKKIRELKEQKRFAEWSKKWITVTRLKKRAVMDRWSYRTLSRQA